MAFHSNLKITGLAATAGLSVAYVRNIIENHKYTWDSVSDFLSWWFIHYIACLFVIGIAYVIVSGTNICSFLKNESLKKIDIDHVFIIGLIVIFGTSVAILFFYLLNGTYSPEMDS